jgi:hypothetical protein
MLDSTTMPQDGANITYEVVNGQLLARIRPKNAGFQAVERLSRYFTEYISINGLVSFYGIANTDKIPRREDNR